MIGKRPHVRKPVSVVWPIRREKVKSSDGSDQDVLRVDSRVVTIAEWIDGKAVGFDVVFGGQSVVC